MGRRRMKQHRKMGENACWRLLCCLCYSIAEAQRQEEDEKRKPHTYRPSVKPRQSTEPNKPLSPQPSSKHTKLSNPTEPTKPDMGQQEEATKTGSLEPTQSDKEPTQSNTSSSQQKSTESNMGTTERSTSTPGVEPPAGGGDGGGGSNQMQGEVKSSATSGEGTGILISIHIPVSPVAK